MLRILLGFLPWIVFGVVSGPALWRLKAAVIIALALVPVMGSRQLAKGFFLTWGTLLFFAFSLIAVVWLENPFVIRNLDVLAKGSLAAIAWVSILAGQPFVLQYARETVPPEGQASPLFFRTCRTLAVFWGVVFLLAAGMSLGKTWGWWEDGMWYQAATLGLVGVGLWLNRWYPGCVRGKAEAAGRAGMVPD